MLLALKCNLESTKFWQENILTRAMNVWMTCEDGVPAQSAPWPLLPEVIYNFYWLFQ